MKHVIDELYMFCIRLQYMFKVKDEISIVTIYKVSTFSVLVLWPDGGWILKTKSIARKTLIGRCLCVVDN